MRRRDRNNRDLFGTHIKVVKSRGTEYYYYVMPEGGLESLGKDREEAIEAAHILNHHLRPAGDIAQRILNNTGKRRKKALDSIEKLIGEYRKLVLDEKDKRRKKETGKKQKKNRTREETEYRLKNYIEEWGERSCATMTTRDIANFLNPLSDHAYIKHRSLLQDLFSFSIHQGYREDNPVQNTRPRTAPKRVKQRHTLEGFHKVREAAPEWLQNAMDIALYSLQRRSDITSLHIDQLDMKKETLKVLQEKTENYDKPVFIEIEMGHELRAVIERSIASPIKCPYLIKAKPKRMTKQIRDSKPHPFSVTADHLTKTFKQVRDSSGAYDKLPPELRPTFHDIRALGVFLYEQAGFPDAYIAALSGHATEAMLEHYKAGHAEQKPIAVRADLQLDKEN